ncbi:hypothetical protein EYC80_003784 [Monilinia laxa]|uniref:Uncharacterized protein n=1 Tax=Monilinia laxa TaxID=61186 RepID=A0A5N6KMM5_MONLA|nr:hypothetical protein EYC80_003784 [Monilinia laxa]
MPFSITSSPSTYNGPPNIHEVNIIHSNQNANLESFKILQVDDRSHHPSFSRAYILCPVFRLTHSSC